VDGSVRWHARFSLSAGTNIAAPSTASTKKGQLAGGIMHVWVGAPPTAVIRMQQLAPIASLR